MLSLTEYRNAARTCLWLSLAEADAEYGIVELFGLRAAGGGSVNKGAKRMYDVMNKLEARV